mmetsp:Transcript_15864/g.38611  ORF Transcript_15864/g.38611 Transcript_15864/m.38611 type:complete len:103 (+) Transcript_15864:98-406(+)
MRGATDMPGWGSVVLGSTNGEFMIPFLQGDCAVNCDIVTMFRQRQKGNVPGARVPSMKHEYGSVEVLCERANRSVFVADEGGVLLERTEEKQFALSEEIRGS